MSSSEIRPEKITRPFQLMAAWFVMLILCISILLTTAVKIEHPAWGSAFLLIFTAFLTIIIIACVFLMLTVFRPNLQDGQEYSEWLKSEGKYSSQHIRIKQATKRKTPSASNLLTSPSYEILPPEEKIEKLETMIEASKIDCYISNCYDSKSLLIALRSAGFSASVYTGRTKDDFDPSGTDSQAIWVGSSVPSRAAIRTIQIAIQYFDFLKYIHLSQDSPAPEETDFEMFFGGATSTAISYGLKPWIRSEIDCMSENLSLKEFHELIRSKYS